jgi:GGDEF domain-containing protein
MPAMSPGWGCASPNRRAIVEGVFTAIPSQRVLMVAALGSFGAVYATFYFVERGNLGIGHFYYVPIALAAIAGGTWIGGAAGVTATVLYAVGVILSPRIPSSDAPTLQTGIRAITFVSIGLLIGWFATATRRMHSELSILAERDHLTGLPNTRAFEKAIGRHLSVGARFVLIILHVEGLGVDSEVSERALRQVGDTVSSCAGPGDEIARIGDGEFAVLRSATNPSEAVCHFERGLSGSRVRAILGWATFPDDGDNALALYRAADERLYARRIFSNYEAPDAESADWSETGAR